MCTVNRAKKIITGVWIFALIYCFPWLFLTTTFPLHYYGFETSILTCDFKLSRDAYLLYFGTDLLVFYVVPLLLSVVLYGLIARILFRSHTAKGSIKSNGPLQVDSSKTNAARVQVSTCNVILLLIHCVCCLFSAHSVCICRSPFFYGQLA